MATALSKVKAAVLAMLTRKASDLVFTDGTYTIDMLLQSINTAKDFTQRAIDLEYAKKFVQVSNVSLTNGGSLDDAKLFGTATDVTVKSVTKAYLSINGSTTAFRPISLMSRETYNRRLMQQFDNAVTDQEARTVPTSNIGPAAIVQVGRTFYVQPASVDVVGTNPFTAYFDAIQWVDDFVDDTEESFLFTYCFDYIVLQTLVALQLYLKEDQRVAIDDSVMKTAWNNVIMWNATIIGNKVDDNSLD